MKTRMMSIAILICASIALPQITPAAAKGSIRVIVKNMANDKGAVRIALFNSEETYSGKTSEPLRKAETKISGKRAEYVLTDLPYGEYAIKLFHDENGNGILDKNFVGIPNEDYAFSNNAKGSFGPAKYAKAKFKLEESELVMEIDMTASE
jgi:uncharacterized protein (DUF2141 family)